MSNEVLFEQKGQLGLITLNRPNALNALTLPMIQAMQQQLQKWKTDNSIKAVVVVAAPGKAFCAGGDVRWLYDAGKQGDAQQMQFFWHEYRLNHFINSFGKPYISLIDGMVMGGGVGISLHGSHPIASERFVFAMPETTIGFFPDIGASYLLNRCPGSLGIYLALTGNRLKAQDAKKTGLVKYLLASESMPKLLEALIAADLSSDAGAQVDACIEQFERAHDASEASALNPMIDTCFAQASVELIYQTLEKMDNQWAITNVDTLKKKAPLSLKITLAQMHKTKTLSLADCLKMDYDLVSHFMQGSDFYEGVRALLVDKDHNPQWQPADLDLVTEKMVISYFERSGSGLALISA